jgi:hypothetical protein
MRGLRGGGEGGVCECCERCRARRCSQHEPIRKLDGSFMDKFAVQQGGTKDSDEDDRGDGSDEVRAPVAPGSKV